MAPTETRSQQARLDQHEEQLQQLQADVSEIKTLLKTWEGDRAEEEEFRKLVMSWAKQQGKQPDTETGGSSMVSGTPPVGPTSLMGDVQTLLVGSEIPIKSPQHNSGVTPQNGGFPWAAKKVNLPEFSGFDPRGWITKAELFFEIHGTHPELRIRLAQLSMTGVAQHWFSVVKGIYDPLSWDQLKRELLQRFSGLEIQNPYEQLSTIQQVSTIYDYIDDFEYLLSLVPRLPESQALGYFLAGLRPEVKQWVRLHRPQTRLDAMYLAKDVEEMLNPSDHSALTARYRYQFPHNSDASLLGPLMHPGGQHVSKTQNTYSTFDRRLPNRADSTKNSSITSVVDQNRSEGFIPPGARHRGVHSLSRSEWEERRRKGLCFKCGQQFGSGHKCPEANLRVLLLADDDDVDAMGEIKLLDSAAETAPGNVVLH